MSASIRDAQALPADLRARLVAWYSKPVVTFAERFGIRARTLAQGQRYIDASPALRRFGVEVDTWPVPAAGLFVPEERTVYLRSDSDLTLAHEFAHGLDCALGGGGYYSHESDAWRLAYNACDAFVTPYAAAGLDEFFAESLRAYVGANDPQCLWPTVTRECLRPNVLRLVRSALALAGRSK